MDKNYVYALLCEEENGGLSGNGLLIDLFHKEEECQERLRSCVEEQTRMWGNKFEYDPDDNGCKVDPMVEGKLPNGWEVPVSTNERYQLRNDAQYGCYYHIWIENRKVI